MSIFPNYTVYAQDALFKRIFASPGLQCKKGFLYHAYVQVVSAASLGGGGRGKMEETYLNQNCEATIQTDLRRKVKLSSSQDVPRFSSLFLWASRMRSVGNWNQGCARGGTSSVVGTREIILYFSFDFPSKDSLPFLLRSVWFDDCSLKTWPTENSTLIRNEQRFQP